MRREVPLVPEVNPSEITQRKPTDYVVRFVFGAAISLVAGLMGIKFGPVVGGLCLGFPAILPASLTLIEKKEGKEEASIDSLGAILGAVALVAFAVVVSMWVTKWGVVASVVVALLVWVAVSAALYGLVAAVFRREPAPP